MTSFPSLITAPLPPANGSSIGESLHHPAFQGMPWKAGHHENWGIFNRRFWGVYVRHSHYKGRKASIDGEELRRLVAEGLTPTQIAGRLKIARQSVYRVLKGAA
jgi:hypothetical protein